MSAPFNIDLPTNVRFGTGVRSEILPLLEEHGWQNVLVIASERTLEDSVSGPFIRELASAVKNLSTFTQIRPNPRISDINDCYLQYVDAGVDVVFGIGGGSCLDQTKATAMAISNRLDPTQMLGSSQALPRRELPLILLPTTSGTGAEVSWSSIVTDEVTKKKGGIRGKTLAADWAFVDPELTVNMPVGVTSVTGFDVLTHAMETFFSTKRNLFTIDLSRHAVRAVFSNLPLLSSDPSNIEARSNMAYASLIMGINLALSSTCLPHRLQYPIGSLTDTAHAEGLAALYPAWLRSTLPHATDLMAECAAWIDPEAAAFGSQEGALRLVALVDQLLDEIGMRRSLTELGIQSGQAAELTGMVTGNLALDPGDVSPAAIQAIYERSM